jgi:uncharacterized protein YeaO (DUF488 family)
MLESLDPTAPVQHPGAMLRTKSIHTPTATEDGLRILVARFRGRGMPKDRYDVWMANLGPSEQLLRSYQRGEVSWAEYARRYKAEILAASSPFDERNATIKNLGQKFTLRLLRHLAERGPVTLLCHCAEDETHCHRHLLARLIERS